MEVFKRYDSKGKLKQEQGMFMFYSPTGVLYYGDVVTGKIKWMRDLKKIAYQAARLIDDEKYVDVGPDGNTLHLYSPDSVSQGLILGDSEEDLHLNLKNIFGKDARVTRNESVSYLTRDLGQETNGGDKNSFEIRMTEWKVSIDGWWLVRYGNVHAFSRCADDSFVEMPNLFHARTDVKFIRLCDRFNVYELPGDGILTSIINRRRRIRVLDLIQKKGEISYFNGTVGKIEVFVKRIPIKNEALKNTLEDAYTRCNQIQAVVKLILVEKDDKFCYLAFEKFHSSLASYIKNDTLALDQFHPRILRAIVKALQELHSHSIFHCNICPEHILVNIGFSSNCQDVVIKFCGMGSSIKSLPRDFSEAKQYHDSEKRMLGRTFLNLMTSGAYSFKEGDELPHFSAPTTGIPGLDLLKLDPVSNDLIQKLASNSSSIKLELILDHVIFWNETQTIHFLEGLSDQIFAWNSYQDIGRLGSEIFGNNWILPDDAYFRKWFLSMIYAPVEKRVNVFPTPGTDTWVDITEEIKSEYNVERLEDLLKLVRNTSHHPRSTYPASSRAELHEYLVYNYPNLVIVLYNYTLSQTESLLAHWFQLGML